MEENKQITNEDIKKTNIENNTNNQNIEDIQVPKSKKEKKTKKRKEKNKFQEPKEKASFNLPEMIILIIITGVISSITSGIIINHKNSTSNGTSYASLLKDKDLQEFLDVYASVSQGYYENIDKKSAIAGAIEGLMDYVGDNYTSYLDKSDANALDNSLKGTYKGIGISISGEEVGLIVKVYPNTPASAAGLQENDKITAVNGNDITNLNNNEIVNLMKKDNAKKVTLTILRQNSSFDVELAIKELISPCIDYQIMINNDHPIGYLQIESFTDTLSKQVETALQEMEKQGIESLILDLRNNVGGLLTALTDTANLFLEKGKVIYTLTSKDDTKTYSDDTNTKRQYPIVVLINGATASASEILTAALKESYGAITVGTTSYGKGKVQKTKRLTDGSLVKYTTYNWLTPNGDCIDVYGINPDYGVELEYEFDDKGNIIEVVDTQLMKALSLLSNNNN